MSAYWVLPTLFKKAPLLHPTLRAFSVLYSRLSCKLIFMQNQTVDSNVTFEFYGST